MEFVVCAKLSYYHRTDAFIYYFTTISYLPEGQILSSMSITLFRPFFERKNLTMKKVYILQTCMQFVCEYVN